MEKNYESFHTWLTDNYDTYDNRNVVTDPTIIDTDKELFILSGLYYWKNLAKINEEINKLSLENVTNDVYKITGLVNAKKEGKETRKKYL
jgi:hypothetical protein